jgi:hypothetical protein
MFQIVEQHGFPLARSKIGGRSKCRTEFIQLNLKGSAVSASHQVFRASLEGLGTRHDEPESIGQPTDRVFQLETGTVLIAEPFATTRHFADSS